jgi:(E)-4-hydroxy-3-methylbut-2-enyl-diphosphate synthase
LTDHRLKDADIVDHLVELVEKKAAEVEATRLATAEAPLETAK